MTVISGLLQRRHELKTTDDVHVRARFQQLVYALGVAVGSCYAERRLPTIVALVGVDIRFKVTFEL